MYFLEPESGGGVVWRYGYARRKKLCPHYCIFYCFAQILHRKKAQMLHRKHLRSICENKSV